MATSRSKPPGRWKKGESGNTKGRPPGSGKVAAFRAALGKDLDSIVKAIVDKAMGGDIGAARLVLERVVPALKPVEESVIVALDGATLAEQGRAALKALADGRLAPGQGTAVLQAIASLAKLVETDELAARVAELEKRHGVIGSKT